MKYITSHNNSQLDTPGLRTGNIVHQGYFKECSSVIVCRLFYRVLDLMTVHKQALICFI